MARISVVLPHPLGPSRPVIAPVAAVSDTAWRISRPPRFTRSPSTRIAGSPVSPRAVARSLGAAAGRSATSPPPYFATVRRGSLPICGAPAHVALAAMDAEPAIVDRTELDALFGALRERGYTVVGPTVRSRRDRLRRARSARATCPPAGSTSRRAAPTACSARDDEALFAHTVGHDSLKRFLFPPRLALWRARRGADGALEVEPSPPPPPRYAFIGVRSCDLHAVAIQDRVFLGDRYVDADYEARRARRVLRRGQLRRARAAPASASRWTPARASTAGFDLALTELLDERRPPLPRRGRQRARRRGPGRARPRAPPEERGRRAPTRPSSRRAAARWAARSTPTDIRDLLQRQRRAPALGRGRRPLPELRQLHDGLPDVLLQHGRGRHRPRGRRDRAHAAVGLVLHARALLRARRQRAPDRRARATASG